MVSRNKIPKEIYRRTAGPVKTGNGTKVEDLKPKDWEQVPGTGGSPHNPPRFRLTKEARKRQQTKFKLKEAKKKEEVTKPAVEALYKGVKEGAPYARLTRGVREGAERVKKDRIARLEREGRTAADVGRKARQAESAKLRGISVPSPVGVTTEKLAEPKGYTGSKAQRSRELQEKLQDPLWGVGHSGSEQFTKGGKVSKSKGGTVKKMRGGKLHTKKTKTIDYKHHGGELVAALYDKEK